MCSSDSENIVDQLNAFNDSNDYDEQEQYQMEDEYIENERVNYSQANRNFKNNILKLKPEKPEELQTSFEKATISYKKFYFGDCLLYSLIDDTFNHFGNLEDKCIDVNRKPGQIVYLYISNKNVDYNEYEIKIINELQKEYQAKYNDKVALYYIMSNSDDIFYTDDKLYLEEECNVIFSKIKIPHFAGVSIFIDEEGKMVKKEEHSDVNFENTLDKKFISDVLDKIIKKNNIHKWISEKKALELHEKLKSFIKLHPLDEFNINDLDIYDLSYDKENDSENSFYTEFVLSGRLLHNEIEKFDKFKEIFVDFFKNEIKEELFEISSFVFYQNQKLTLVNLGKCTRCQKIIPESEPCYVCYKCSQTSQPTQFCTNCVNESNSYKKFYTENSIKKEVEIYNKYINNKVKDDLPCESNHLLIYFPSYGFEYLNQMHYFVSHFQTYLRGKPDQEGNFERYQSQCSLCIENIFIEEPLYFCTVCTARMCHSCMKKTQKEKYDYMNQSDSSILTLKHNYKHPCIVVQSAFIKPTYEEFIKVHLV